MKQSGHLPKHYGIRYGAQGIRSESGAGRKAHGWCILPSVLCYLISVFFLCTVFDILRPLPCQNSIHPIDKNHRKGYIPAMKMDVGFRLLISARTERKDLK